MKQVSKRGGKREGAGRKKGEPTEMIRVCSALAAAFKEFSDFYKADDDGDRKSRMKKRANTMASLYRKEMRD